MLPMIAKSITVLHTYPNQNLRLSRRFDQALYGPITDNAPYGARKVYQPHSFLGLPLKGFLFMPWDSYYP